MVWTEVHAGAFLDYVEDNAPDELPLWHLAVHRDLRRGELASLPWSETRLNAAELEVRTQLTEIEYEVT